MKLRTLILCSVLAASPSVFAQAPSYQIIDIGVVGTDTASQAFGISRGGDVAVGRSLGSGVNHAFSWTNMGGLVALPNPTNPARAFCVANGANDNGIVVGNGATTTFNSSHIPLIWQGGNVATLPLPAGQTLGDANGVNSSGTAVGSVGAGVSQVGVIYTGGSGGNASLISQTTTGGSYFQTALGINDAGRIIGVGIDPNNAARNVGIVYDMGQANAIEVGAVPGANGALCFGVSSNGFVCGSSMQNQGSGVAFIWSQSAGISPIPLPPATSQAIGYGVNSTGWVVGTAGGQFAVPFLWDGKNTYRLQDLIPANSGWDLSTNTSISARGISNRGTITGWGVHNGLVHAFAMILTNESQVCHKHSTTYTLPTNSLDLQRHLDHGDPLGVCTQ